MTAPPIQDPTPYVDPQKEITVLPPKQERQFTAWAKRNKITDVNSPDSHYDYRGYWLTNPTKTIKFGKDHFPDTFKQHGHPTFSMESQYSKGFGDGGMWVGDNFMPEHQVKLFQALLGLFK